MMMVAVNGAGSSRSGSAVWAWVWLVVVCQRPYGLTMSGREGAGQTGSGSSLTGPGAVRRPVQRLFVRRLGRSGSYGSPTGQGGRVCCLGGRAGVRGSGSQGWLLLLSSVVVARGRRDGQQCDDTREAQGGEGDGGDPRDERGRVVSGTGDGAGGMTTTGCLVWVGGWWWVVDDGG